MGEVGPGKPPVEHRFKKGQSGNPGGKTSEQRLQEIANAAMATKLRARFLAALVEMTDGGVDTTLMDAALLKMRGK